MANSKKLIEYKKLLALTQEQHEVLVGTLLGDATMPAQRGNALWNVKFEQRLDRVDYVNHLHGLFAPWVNLDWRLDYIGTSLSLSVYSGLLRRIL